MESSFSPGPILILPPLDTIHEYSVFAPACERPETSLALLKTEKEAKKDPFMKVTLGEVKLEELPEGVLAEPVLVGILEEMRDASAKTDTEFCSAIYQGEDGYFVLREPSSGGYNGIDNYYESGLTPIVAGFVPLIGIHSHPPGLRFRSETKEQKRAAQNVASQHDFGRLLYTRKNLENDHYQSEIIAGQEMASLVCRTKDTAPKIQGIDEKNRWVFVKVLDRLNQIDRDIREGHADLPAMRQRLTAIVQTCQEYRLGLYLKRLRKTGSADSLWVRFNPWPRDINRALTLLLG